MVVLLFASAYTSVGLEDASAMKAKKTKSESVKAKKGLLAQKMAKPITPIKTPKK